MSPPVTVHHLSPDGGRRVSVRSAADTHILGIAYSDRDVVEFLRRSARTSLICCSMTLLGSGGVAEGRMSGRRHERPDRAACCLIAAGRVIAGR
ncbi:hypothetical protein ACFYY2_31275 [Streptomyces sp. NPDC001822]|uniref:hypothetical protein n=1 Tax=Streptomyces sp. NPDC001822 TaxID=3364614 RepID=UPI00367527C4